MARLKSARQHVSRKRRKQGDRHQIRRDPSMRQSEPFS
jgi:hypothetical protein